jgi:hypothetical protein
MECELLKKELEGLIRKKIEYENKRTIYTNYKLELLNIQNWTNSEKELLKSVSNLILEFEFRLRDINKQIDDYNEEINFYSKEKDSWMKV